MLIALHPKLAGEAVVANCAGTKTTQLYDR
jgi:hypothetical protein